MQLPALPEALPDAQLLEGGMSAPDSASVAEEDLPTSVKALLGPMHGAREALVTLSMDFLGFLAEDTRAEQFLVPQLHAC